MFKRILFLVLGIMIFSRITAQIDTSLYNMSVEDLMTKEVKSGGVYSQSVFESLVSSTVITREMIEKYNFQSVKEAVQTVAGLFISRTYLTQNIPTARGLLQTHYANKVLILINGIPTWFSMTNEGFLDRLSINDIEKIEILKGPASVTYGTNAYAAAINIVLKNVKANSLSSVMQVGSGYTIESNTNYSFIKGDFRFFVSANSRNQQGFKYFFTGEDGQSGYVKDRLNISNFTFLTSYKSHTLFFNAYDLNGINFGPRLTFATGAGKQALVYGYLAYYRFMKKISEKCLINNDVSVDWNVRDLAISQDSWRHVLFDGYRFAANSRLKWNINTKIFLNFGLNAEYRESSRLLDFDAQNDSVISYPVGNHTFNVYNNGMYKEGIWEFAEYARFNYVANKFSFLFGYRLTYNFLYKFNNSVTATFIYKLNRNNTVKLFYGDSYRSPSIFETNLIYPVILGNPGLKPEIGGTLELSYLYQSKYLKLQVLGYISQYKNLIVRQLVDTFFIDTTLRINVYENGDELQTSGVEAELNYDNPSVLGFFINYTFINPLKNGEKYYLNFVPHHTVTAGINKQIKNFNASAVVNYWSSMDGPLQKIPAQWWLDINFSFSHSIKKVKFTHTLSAKNVLNKNIVVPEFVRQNINALPVGFYRYISYTFRVKF